MKEEFEPITEKDVIHLQVPPIHGIDKNRFCGFVKELKRWIDQRENLFGNRDKKEDFHNEYWEGKEQEMKALRDKLDELAPLCKVKEKMKVCPYIKCVFCGQELIEVADKMTGKKTGHIFKCSCKDWSLNFRVSIG